ncbi:MAG: thioredoxin family protein [Melioribacteraceae bacterium]
MKKISLLLLTVFIVFSCTDNKKANSKALVEGNNTETSEVVWHTNLEQAIVIAEKENKQILLQFSGSDWCHWCKRLNEEVLETKEFENYAQDNMVLVNLDYPKSIPQTDKVKEYNQKMLQKYGVRGFPTVLLLDKTGKVVKQTGFVAGGPSKYIKHIKDAYASK